METKIKTISQKVGRDNVNVQVAEITESPIVKQYTEKQVDILLQAAINDLMRIQAEVDKWTVIK